MPQIFEEIWQDAKPFWDDLAFQVEDVEAIEQAKCADKGVDWKEYNAYLVARAAKTEIGLPHYE